MTEEYQISYDWDISYNLFQDPQDIGPETREYLDIGIDEVPTVDQMNELDTLTPFDYPGRQLITGVRNNIEIQLKNEGEQIFPGCRLTNIELMIPIGGTYTQTISRSNYRVPPLEPNEKYSLRIDAGRPGKVNIGDFSFELIPDDDGEEIKIWNRTTGEETTNFSITIVDKDRLRTLSELHKIRQIMEAALLEE